MNLPQQRRDFQPDWWLYFCLLLALALRLDFLLANNFTIDADEAIVGLMARHINEGRPVPIFYYGQHYMGSFEALMVSAVFRVFGASSAGLKAVPLVFSLIFVFLCYRIALELGGTAAARIAALLAAVPPSALVVWSAMARGGFIEVVVLGSWAIYGAIRWLKRDEPRLIRAPDSTAAIGLILGFGWWVNNQILYFVLPIGFVMMSRLIWEQRWRATTAHAVAGTAAFICGSLPFWLYNVANNFASFGMFGLASWSEAADHAAGTFSKALPILLGAKRFWQDDDVYPGSSLLVYALYLSLFALLIAERRKRLYRLAVLKVDRQQPVEILLLLLFASLAVFAMSSYGWLVQAPRYLLPIYLSVIVLSALTVARARTGYRRALLFALIATNLCSSYLNGRAVPGEPFVFKGERVSKDQSELIKWLREHRIGWVRTNYWIGYRLAFETNEEVRFVVFNDPMQTRIEEYRQASYFLDRELFPLIVVPSQAPLVRNALQTLRHGFKERELSGYVVFYDLTPDSPAQRPVPASEWTVWASDQGEKASSAADGNLLTRWGSGRAQRPGMEFRIDLRQARLLRELRYDLASWATDYPRALQLELELEDGTRATVLSPQEWEAVRFYASCASPIILRLPPLRTKALVMKELGSDPVFDWSIAEISLFE